MEKRSYDKDGNESVENCSWGKNWKDLTSPFSEDINLTGDCFDICVKAKECTGLVWEWWRNLIDVSNVPQIKSRTFSIRGTTLSPIKSINPEI